VRVSWWCTIMQRCQAAWQWLPCIKAVPSASTASHMLLHMAGNLYLPVPIGLARPNLGTVQPLKLVACSLTWVKTHCARHVVVRHQITYVFLAVSSAHYRLMTLCAGLSQGFACRGRHAPLLT
jgi:hypothetical protein